MNKPKATTHEDEWMNYIASILEEIRDAIKPAQTTVINTTIKAVDVKTVEKALNEQQNIQRIKEMASIPDPPKPPETIRITEGRHKPPQKNGSATRKRVNSNGKNV